MQREVAFLAVDEIQLAADHARHVFTDRLLHARRRRRPCSLARTPSARSCGGWCPRPR